MVTLEQVLDAAKHFNMDNDWTFFDLFKTKPLEFDYTDVRFVRAAFDILERYPDDDGYEAFWSILHLLEKVPNYETELAESIRRQPTLMTEIMVSRILNSEPATSQIDWITLLRDAENHPDCPSRVRGYIQETIHRNTDTYELRQRELDRLLCNLETSQTGWETTASNAIEELRFNHYVYTYRVNKFLAPLYEATDKSYFARVLPKLESYDHFEDHILSDMIHTPTRFHAAMVERFLKNPQRKTPLQDIINRLNRVHASAKCPEDVRLEIERILESHKTDC